MLVSMELGSGVVSPEELRPHAQLSSHRAVLHLQGFWVAPPLTSVHDFLNSQHAVPFSFWCLGVTQVTSLISVLLVSLKGTRKI